MHKTLYDTRLGDFLIGVGIAFFFFSLGYHTGSRSVPAASPPAVSAACPASCIPFFTNGKHKGTLLCKAQ